LGGWGGVVGAKRTFREKKKKVRRTQIERSATVYPLESRTDLNRG